MTNLQEYQVLKSHWTEKTLANRQKFSLQCTLCQLHSHYSGWISLVV